MTGFPVAVRKMILARAGNRCERCTAWNVTDIHHRRPRGAGGSKDPVANTAANGVALCRSCHSWCESQRASALTRGWLVRQSQDPRRVPVFYQGRWAFLTIDGAIMGVTS